MRPRDLRSLRWLVPGAAVFVAAGALMAGGGSPGSESGAATGRIFSDEFSGAAGSPPDPAKWSIRIGGNWGNGRERQAYTDRPANVALDGKGHLLIRTRRESYTGEDGITRAYTSARIDTAEKFTTRYGRIAARIRMPAGKGLLPAFWALPRSLGADTNRSGELDVVEVDGRRPDVVLGSVHAPDGRGGQAHTTNHQTLSRSTASRYHVFSLDWTPSRLVYRVDGKAYATVKRSELRGRWVFSEPHFLLLNVAVGNPATGAPDAGTRLPATMAVDWVRVSHLRAP